jgi:hypothetical protein
MKQKFVGRTVASQINTRLGQEVATTSLSSASVVTLNDPGGDRRNGMTNVALSTHDLGRGLDDRRERNDAHRPAQQNR